MRTAVMDCLSATGSRYHLVSTDQQRVARELADGFGPLHPVIHAALVWDWSHVRDSSPGGFARMYEYLRVEGLIA